MWLYNEKNPTVVINSDNVGAIHKGFYEEIENPETKEIQKAPTIRFYQQPFEGSHFFWKLDTISERDQVYKDLITKLQLKNSLLRIG